MSIVKLAIETIENWVTKNSVTPTDGRPAIVVTKNAAGEIKEMNLKAGFENAQLGNLPYFGRRLPEGFVTTNALGDIKANEDLSFQDPVDVLSKILRTYQAPSFSPTIPNGAQAVSTITYKVGQSLPASLVITLNKTNNQNIENSGTSGNVLFNFPQYVVSGTGNFNASTTNQITINFDPDAPDRVITDLSTMLFTITIRNTQGQTVTRYITLNFWPSIYAGESNLAKLVSSAEVNALRLKAQDNNINFNIYNFLGGNTYHYVAISNLLTQTNLQFIDTTGGAASTVPYPIAVQNDPGADGAFDTTAPATVTVNNGFMNEVCTIYRTVNRITTNSQLTLKR